ncbi:hypothetical protein MNBD_GAMMA12-377 [hydrothermal vent metagenome]|uniref:Histone deacetylase domain-containing protein n=1 Tax=hydrothermal vent metagenome TaxID=652676 RepID=A0A3B0YDX0_9ZZZZ
MANKIHSSIRIVYSPDYDIRFAGMEKFHPFDSRKYSRAWEVLRKKFGSALEQNRIIPKTPISDESLLKVHSKAYLKSLGKSRTIARALELPILRFIPAKLLSRWVLDPMRLAVAGTVIAARKALQNGVAVNLAGGYHHATADRGQGFCLFADVGVAVAELRASSHLQSDDQVMIIDLDAHQGNGNEHVFRQDPNMHILDMYNKDVYPNDVLARERIDMDIPVVSGINEDIYLSILRDKLPRFLASVKDPKLIFYIAGTDILAKDPLGSMNVSAKGVLERDMMVFNALVDAAIPFVMVTSGGYTSASYRLIADSLSYLLTTFSTAEND